MAAGDAWGRLWELPAQRLRPRPQPRTAPGSPSTARSSRAAPACCHLLLSARALETPVPGPPSQVALDGGSGAPWWPRVEVFWASGCGDSQRSVRRDQGDVPEENTALLGGALWGAGRCSHAQTPPTLRCRGTHTACTATPSPAPGCAGRSRAHPQPRTAPAAGGLRGRLASRGAGTSRHEHVTGLPGGVRRRHRRARANGPASPRAASCTPPLASAAGHMRGHRRASRGGTGRVSLGPAPPLGPERLISRHQLSSKGICG